LNRQPTLFADFIRLSLYSSA